MIRVETAQQRGQRGRLRAYAELGRVSNLPTVWTNVLTGVALGAAGAAAFPWGSWVLVAIAVSLFYVAGMAMNDVMDAELDRLERPGRPIPSGRVSAREAQGLIFVCLIAGAAILAPAGPTLMAAGLALILAIALYNRLHQRMAAAVILMGLCRGLVYVLAALAAGGRGQLVTLTVFAAAISAYTVLITVVARGEVGGERGAARWLALLLPVVALAPLAVAQPETGLAWLLAGIVAAWLLWVGFNLIWRRPPVVRVIMAWIAAMCLLDAFYLGLLDYPVPAAVAAALFLVTRIGHRRVLGS